MLRPERLTLKTQEAARTPPHVLIFPQHFKGEIVAWSLPPLAAVVDLLKGSPFAKELNEAVDRLAGCADAGGSVHVTGMGKSGAICQKLS